MLTYEEKIHFELCVYDLIESKKVKTASELEMISMDLHERIEVVIMDYISESDEIDDMDYKPYC